MEKTFNFSPTSINILFSCPRNFYYKYILGLSSKPNIYFFKGNVVHSILEHMFDRKTPKGLLKYVKSEFETEWARLGNETFGLTTKELTNHKEEAYIMITEFTKRFLNKLKITLLDGKVNGEFHAWNLLKPKFKEEKIECPGLQLTGKIDIIQEDYNGRIFIIDYKTSKLFKDTVSEDYIRQVRLYALLYYKKYNKLPNYTGVNYLKYGETYLLPVTTELIKQAEQDLQYAKDNTQSSDINDYRACDWEYCEHFQFEKESKV